MNNDGNKSPKEQKPESEKNQSDSYANDFSKSNKSENSSDSWERFKQKNSSEQSSNYEQKKEKAGRTYDELSDKMKEAVGNIKESELYTYVASNKEQTITYTLLALGIIFLFINSLLGGLIVGGIAGYYFSESVVYYIRNLNKLYDGNDQLRYIVLTGLIIGLIIAAPGIFIGAVVVAVFKEVLFKKGKKDNRYIDQSIDSSQRDYDPKDNHRSR